MTMKKDAREMYVNDEYLFNFKVAKMKHRTELVNLHWSTSNNDWSIFYFFYFMLEK